MPHRLTRPTTLKGAATGRRGIRWRLISHTPTVLIDYLFEILIAVVCGLGGIGLVTGFSQSAVVRLIPPQLVYVFGSLFIIAGALSLVGMLRGKYGTILPTGLRLVAMVCLTYTVVVVGFLGWRNGWFTILFSLSFAALAAWRAFLLKSTYLLLLGEAGSRVDP